MTRTQTGTEAAGPAFSFLTTAYRSEDTLPRTVDSVLAQTREDWELVVVDNGWDEAIAKAIAPYLGDPRVRFTRQENRGASGGTMAAADIATGRFFVPLNSDDAVTPEFCERTGEVLASDPGIAAVTCDAHLFVDPGERRLSKGYLEHAGQTTPPDPDTPMRLADVIDGPSPYYTAAIRHDVWTAMGGMASDTPLVDDLDFWLRTIVAGYDVRMIPDRLARFRVQAGSVSRPTDNERIEQFEAQRERALRRAAESSDDPEAAAALERVLCRQRYQQHLRRGRVAFREGDLDSARQHIRAAFALRRSARSAAVLAGLRIAPRLLGAVHPTKQRLTRALNNARELDWRWRPRRRAGSREDS